MIPIDTVDRKAGGVLTRPFPIRWKDRYPGKALRLGLFVILDDSPVLVT